jgi:hypothetical protein
MATIRRLPIAVVLLVASAALGQQPFEAVASGTQISGCLIVPTVRPLVQWFRPDRIDDSAFPGVAAIASGDRQRVLALLVSTPLRVVELRSDGTRTPFYTGGPGTSADVIAVAATGRVFAMSEATLTVLSPAGALEATHAVPNLGVNALAVAPDGCTLYYQSGYDPAIKRVNGCTGAALPDFGAAIDAVYDMHVLRNGQLLVAVDRLVWLYDTNGASLRPVAFLPTYGLGAFRAQQIATGDRDEVLWIAATTLCDDDQVPSHLLRVSLADGKLLSARPLDLDTASGLVIGTIDFPADVPAAGTAGLLALTMTIAAGAVRVLRG